MVVDLQEDSLVVMEALTNKDATAVSVTACLGALEVVEVLRVRAQLQVQVVVAATQVVAWVITVALPMVEEEAPTILETIRAIRVGTTVVMEP